jgi:hypothetical protein
MVGMTGQETRFFQKTQETRFFQKTQETRFFANRVSEILQI